MEGKPDSLEAPAAPGAGGPASARRTHGPGDTLPAAPQEPLDAGLPAPDLLGPKFEVLGALGQGGSGLVLRVRHRELDRILAAKVLVSCRHDRERLLRFRREARVTGELDHPHIVRVHDFDRTPDGTPFLVMELLEGKDLMQLLAEQGPLPLARVVELMSGVGDALDRAHAAGVVHRDLKPANLFLTTGGRVKVLDFGICHTSDERDKITATGQFLGTPQYVAPEQLRGEAATPRTDVFALGVILYELLAGKVPYEATSLHGLVLRYQEGRAPRIEAEVPGLGPQVGDVLARALAIEPAARQASAGELIRELTAAVAATGAGEAAPERPAPPDHPEPGATPAALPGPAPTRQRPRRSPRRGVLLLLAGLAGLAGLALVAGAALLLQHRRAAPPPVLHPVLAPPAAWPAVPRLLIVPFAHRPERKVDAELWPLLDRMLASALEADERLLGRLRRVDPLAVAEEIERRELGRPPLPREAARELARSFAADLVLEGSIERRDGVIQLQARLATADRTREATLTASEPRLEDAVRALAGELQQELWPRGAAPAATPERLRMLLLGTPDSLAMLAAADPLLPAGQRHALYARILDADPDALGVLWLRFLDNVWDDRWLEELAQRASRLPDPELGRFFRELARGKDDPAVCTGFDLPALGQRYPLLLGPLAEAACLQRRGELQAATRRALAAFQEHNLRPLARPLLARLAALTRPCNELLPLWSRMQRATPDHVLGWSSLASWYARCDRPDEARSMLAVARALLGRYPDTDYQVAYNAALTHLMDLDVAGAQEWLDLLEQLWRPERRDEKHFTLLGLHAYLQGRYRDGLELTRAGLEGFRQEPDYRTSILATSAIQMLLAQGLDAEAGQVLAAYDALLPPGGSEVEQYERAVLHAALELARAPGGRRPQRVLERVRRLGDRLAATLGDRGRTLRASGECLLLARFGSPASCRALLLAAPAGNNQLGGCRVRHAELLLQERRFAEAREQFRQAIREIVWGTFLHADLVPAALLGQARAAEALGDEAGAATLYRTLTRNFGRSDRLLSEVLAAREALAR